MIPITSWGRLSHDDHLLVTLQELNKAASLIANGRGRPGIAHGMGRSYGDVALNPDGVLWQTTNLDHFISFDESTGRLTCEAGVLLRDIQKQFIPRGWALPVTPGTQMVTVGGAIANDIHGKNHHLLGSFGDHVTHIKLVRTTGEQIECSAKQNPEWFAATVGGLGLTGVILSAQIQLRPVAGPWLDTESIPYSNLTEFFQLADSSEKDWEYTVSWVDCMSSMGRGIFMRANHSTCNEASPSIKPSKTMPLVPPFSLVNNITLRPFNSAYYTLNKLTAGTGVVHYEPFFYPLDKLLEWNRIYGPKGFFQYQSVVPRSVGQDATDAMLKEIKKSGEGSFLAILKTFGNRHSVGMLSFPEPGVTLALDFPNHGAHTHKLFERLDAIIREAKGRIYPAKDARMPHDLFEAGYPKLNEFLHYRDPGISSSLSRRLMGS
jgi:FAD/FMN-containing dehydrogenase